MPVTDLPAPFRLDGLRALITGASRGIGQAIAATFAEAGAELALSARTTQALKPTSDLLNGHNPKRVLIGADLADRGAAEQTVNEAAAALGGLDIIVHNAGTLPQDDDGNPILAPLHKTRQRDFEHVVSVNLNATAALARAAHPHLERSDNASLVIMSSAAAVSGCPGMDAYAATKAAQLALTRSLAVGWARTGIRVNALCPGWVATDMTAAVKNVSAISDWLMAHVPLGRWATPQECAYAALYLASPASSFMTGHAMALDGGLTISEGGLAGIPKPPSPFVS
ncbi:SDR family NAD(P)-dependent oxidoreductase [Streptomyces violaceusniger]|uniref:Short-chain dehydrogenase/reductase SDR n=1 Tax=Streptomyces violaceusniger (strain Tu 4113) TaxID=653045 RepID=G2PHK1_STRV4|nr:SDR family oxidoreductase [Streptomyces violaceusniger]AEM89004.1 short-chain dehydrogenase/reductase SDR [Streptomyces violaceusniger Tu 4113]